ncbi:uncharacterized protein LOC143988218 isoform X2 [Lithobates pipiens]
MNVTTTSYTIEILTPGNYYTILVYAQVGENNLQGGYDIVSNYTIPGVVKNLTAENITTTSISLRWDKPDGNVSSYYIQILEDPRFNTIATTTYDIIEGLTPGNYYTFLVSARVGENNVQGKNVMIAEYTKPGIIKNLVTNNVNTSSISLSWEKPDGNVSYYSVQILGVPALSINVSATSANLGGLIAGNYYTVLINVLVKGDVIPGEIYAINVYTQPGMVRNVLITNVTTESVDLSWLPPDGNYSYYKIEVPEGIFPNTTTSQSISIQGLTPGKQYSVQIIAVTGPDVQGEAEITPTYTRPGMVYSIIPFVIQTSSVHLTWQLPILGAWSYYVIRMQENSTFYLTTNNEHILISELIPGNYYTFLISVKYFDLEGIQQSISLYTRPATVINLTASRINSSAINVSWQLPEGNRSYYQVDVVGDPAQSFNVTTESGSVSNLTIGNPYTVKVAAVAANGLLGESSNIFVAVSNVFSLTNIYSTSVWLNWDTYAVKNATYIISVSGEPSTYETFNTTEIQIYNLTAGNCYTFAISASLNTFFLYGYGGEITWCTQPGPVKQVLTANITTSSVDISWLPPDGNHSYYQIQVTGNTYANQTVSQSWPVQGLTPGNQYTIDINAVNGQGMAGISSGVTITTKPEKVQNLTIFTTTDTSVTLSWQPPDGSISSYLINIQQNETYNQTTNLNTFIVIGLTPGTYYIFNVSALAGFDTVRGESALAAGYALPGIVKNLIKENITTTSISLSWEKPDGNASSYLIQILEEPAFNRKATTTSDIIEGLTPGNYYTFLVSSFVENVQGSSLVISSYTKPEIVKNLTIWSITTTSISLSWDKPYGNASSYFIHILGDPTFNRTATTTSYIIEGLVPGNYYTILVSAHAGDIAVQGDYVSLSTHTIPDIVKNLNTQHITTTSISLSWDKPDGNASSYLIQILGEPAFNKNVTTTSDIIEGLTPGNYYTFLVSAFVDNTQGYSSAIANYTIPGIVKNLIEENITTTSISLSWEKPDGNASFYFIQILGEPAFNKNVTKTSDIIEGLTPGNYYTFFVSVFVDNIQGNSSVIANYTIPGIVKNLIEENITTTSISLSWEKPDGNASFYFIQILGEPAFNKNVTKTSDIIEGLTPGNYYTFFVSAFVDNIQGNSSVIANYTIPGIVKNLIEENITTTSISLSWEKPDGNASFYFIQILGEPAFNKNVTKTSDIIEGLTPGNYYTFFVSAFVDNIQGNSSVIANYTIPGIVKNLIEENITTTSISLSWEKPDGNASFYFIQILGEPAFNKNVTKTSDIIEGLTPGNYYTFFVSAFVDNIQGNSSVIANYTIPGIVKNLIEENITTTSISLSWEKPDGNASFYFIQILGEPAFNKNVTKTSDIIEGLTPGNYYTFFVSAFVDNIQGNSSVIANYTIPGIVKNLIEENITTTSISLSWEKPDGNASFYFIQILGEPAFNKNVTKTSDIIEGLTPGNYYTFFVSAFVDNIQGNSSVIANYTIPGIVKNLIEENITTTSISLSWEKPDGNASFYFIQILGEPAFNKNVTKTSDIIEGLTPGNYYTFFVSAFVDNIQGNSSVIANYTIPGIVKNLIEENITTTSISLSWEKPDGNASFYFIQILGEPAFNKNVTKTSDIIEGLTPGNYYTFFVSAFVDNIQGNSSVIANYTIPGIVKNLIEENITTTSISLSWDKPDGNASFYSIQILGEPAFIKNVTKTSDIIEGLTPGNYYTFFVSAFVDNIQGNSSVIANYTIPGIVKNLIEENITTTSISLSWDKPDGNASFYFIQILGEPAFNKNVTTTSDIIEGLTPGNYYTFSVSAFVDNIQGNSSVIANYTIPEIVKNLNTQNITTTSISLSWEKPDGNASFYFIQILGEPAFNKNVTTTSNIIEGLTPGNYYIFLVSAFVDDIHGNSSVIANYTIPEIVKNLNTELITTTSISLSWDKPDGNASFYFIQILGEPAFNKNVTTTSDIIEGLTPGNYYTFLVSTVVDNIHSNRSVKAKYTIPEIVKNLNTGHINTTSISLSWEKPKGNASFYFIQILGEPAFNKNVTITSDVIEGLTPGNYYTFLVSAFVDNIQGNSSVIANYTIPEVVKNLNTELITTTSISLSWEKPDGNASFYFIQILGEPAFNKNVTTTSDIIEGLTPGNYYIFFVSAFVDNIQGNSSVIANYTKPNPVTALKASKINSAINLSWQAPSIGFTSSYEVTVYNTTTSWSFRTTVESAQITELIRGNLYTVSVCTVAGSNTLGACSEILVIVSDVICATNISTSSVWLSWDSYGVNGAVYNVSVYGDPFSSLTVNTTQVQIPNLNSGNFYMIQISAYKANVFLYGYGGEITLNTPPGPVQNFQSYNVSTTSVDLSWLPPESNYSHYLIEVTGDRSRNFTTNLQSLSIPDLTPGTQYSLAIMAIAGADVQGEAKTISVTTKPNVVGNLMVQNTYTTAVLLSWEMPTGNADFYLIKIQGNTTYRENINATSFMVQYLTPGIYYTFIVTAVVGADVEGNTSSTSTYTKPATVTNLKATRINNNTIDVSWELPEGNRSYYVLKVWGEPTQKFNFTPTELATITNLTVGNQYIVIVKAVVGDGLQGDSSEISILLSDVINATLIYTTSVWLSWNPYAGVNSSYRISVYGEPSSNLTVNTTQVYLNNLTAGNFYMITISAYINNTILYGYGGDIALYTRPAMVKDVQVSNLTTNSFDLSWPRPDGNNSYYWIEVTGDIPINSSEALLPSYSIRGLTPGNQYTVIVRAVAGKGVLGEANTTVITLRPEVVKNLTILSFNDTSVSLSWQAPEGSISSYIIQIQEYGTYYASTTQTSFTVNDLTPGNNYTFLVTALAGSSNTIGDSASISCFTPPGKVQSLKTENITSTSVSLSWEKPDGNASSYFIEILGDPTFNKTINTTSYIIEGLTPGNYYTFLVSAQVGENHLQGYTINFPVQTRPEKIQSLTAYNISTTSVSLNWLPPTGNASSYQIQILENSSFSVIVPSPTTNFTIQNLIPGNYYTFLVSALVGGNSIKGDSAVTVNYTMPEKVQSLTAYDITTTSLSLNWLPSTGNASSYQIQILENSSFSVIVPSPTTNFSIQNLIPGNYYTFLVSALVGGNSIKGDSSVTVNYTMPEKVQSLTAYDITTTSLSLNWLPPTGNASSYHIQILENSSFSVIVPGPTTNFTIQNLIPGNYYTFLVSSLVGGNSIKGDSSVSVTYTRPEKVQSLTASNIVTTSLSLNWLPPTGNASSYHIQILENSYFSVIVPSLTTSFTIQNLTPGNYYTFLVSALVGGNSIQGDSSVTVTYTTPEKVQSLTAYNIVTTSLSLNWLPPTGNASSYQIQILENSSFSVIVTSATTSFTIENLIPGNYYTFLVSALVGGNRIKGDSSVTVTYTTPEKVQSLTAYDITTTSLSLNWLPPTGNASSYQIQILENSSFSVIVPGPTTNFTIQNLIPGNYYTFLVSALVGGNSIKGDSSVSVTYTRPEKVQSLTASNISTTSLSLNWLSPTGNASSYQIQILENSSFSVIVPSLTTSFTIQNLTPGNYYTFLVSALVGGNRIKGDSFVTVTYTTPEKVQSLTAYNITTTSLSLSWLPPTGNASSYQIQILENSSFSIIVPSPTTNFTIQNLIPGNYYTFLVSALVGGNSIKGDSSVTVTYTRPEKVQSLTAYNITTTSLSLNWLPPTGNASSYQIQILENSSFSVIVPSPTTSFTIQNLTPGNYYTFLVSALVGGNSIKGDNTVTVTYTTPEKVQSLTAYNISTTSLSLNWLPPTGNASSYQIQILENSSFSLIVTSPTTSFTIENLIPGNYYTFLVSALVGGNSIKGDNTVTVTYTTPEKVQSLTAYNITTTSLSLNWLPPSGNASSYQIQILENSSFSVIVPSPTTNFTIQNLTPGNYYTFLVSALVGGNSIKGDSFVTVNYTRPEKVQSLTASNINTTTLSLSWLPPTGNASSYQIQILENSSFIVIVPSPTTSFTIQNLIPGNYYTFLVSALVGGNSIKGDSSVTVNYTTPEKVQSLTAYDITTTSLSLNWLPPTGNASSYQIQILENSSFSVIVPGPTTNFTIQNLIPGNYYTFLVSVLVGGNSIKGDSSVTVTYTTPEKVQSLTAYDITTTSLSLNWLPPAGNASSYQIQMLENSSFSVIVTSPTTSFTIQNLIPGNYYTFLVSALVGGNSIKGDSSVTVTYTRPEKVQSLTASNISTTSLSLGWLPPTGNASSYQIQILENSSFSVIVPSPTTSFTIQNLIPGNYYTFLVSALVGGNSIKGDSSVTVTYTTPEKVQSLTAYDITTTSLSLNWLPPTGNASSYQIQMLENSSFSVIVPSPTTNFTIQNLIPGNYYTFLVSALVGGNSIKGDSSVTVTYTRPEKVQSLTASNISTTSLSLSWLPPTGNASSYQIQILENSSFSVIVPSPTTSFTIQNLTPGNYYTFLVSALVGGNSIKGDSSVTVTYTTPEKVQSLTAYDITTMSLSLNWLPPSGKTSSYQIQMLENSSLSVIVPSPTTNFTIQNLIPGNYYTFLVSALVGGNSIKGDSCVTVTYTRPEKVQSLTSSNISTTSLSLSWLPPTGNASSYHIQILENSSFSVIVPSPTTSFTIQNLTPGNYYTFLVSALVEGNSIKGDSSVTVTYTRPEKVQSLTASNISTMALSLSWLPPTGNASSYQIQILENSSFSVIVPSPTTSFTIENLIPGNYYTFLVSALVGGNSIKGDSSVTVNYTRPEKVQSLTAYNISTTSISLNWLPPTGNASSYQIQIIENSTFGVIVPSPTTSFTIQNLTPGNYYTFLVSALGGNSIKGNSAVTVTYTTPEKVQSLTASNITITSLSLSWLPPTGNASSYQIQILENSSFSVIVPSPTTSFTIQNLTPGNYYTFLVSALAGGSIKGDSSLVVKYTKPGTVKNLAPLPQTITTDTISLSWEKPDGNVSSYMILIEENSTFQSIITANNITISNLKPGNSYKFLVFALTDNSRLQGDNVSTIARTNSISFIVSLSYRSSASDSEILIVNLINEKLQASFPKQNVTAVIKKVQKIVS